MQAFVIDSLPLLRKFAKQAVNQTLYYDSETTGFSSRTCKLVAMQFMREGGTPIIVDWRAFIIGGTVNKAVGILAPVFESSLFIGHNIAFDWEFAASVGLRMRRVWDTMLAEQVILSSGQKGCSLAETMKRRLGIEMSKDERGWFYQPLPLDQRAEWDEPFPDEQLDYMATDVEHLPALHRSQAEDLKKHHLVNTALLEMRALHAVADMGMNGIHINVEGWREMVGKWGEKAREYESKAIDTFGEPIQQDRIEKYDAALSKYEWWERERDTVVSVARSIYDNGIDASLPEQRAAGDVPFLLGYGPIKPQGDEKWGAYKTRLMKAWREDFPNPGKPKLDNSQPNLGSPSQLLVAFTRLGLPIPTKKNEKGETKPTFEAESLEKYKDEYPAIADFLSWKKYAKAETSFGENLLQFLDSDGRIHPNWVQIGAETGRMACREPNWQQIPGKGETQAIRKNVTPAEGNKLLVADFKNIELYILANVSEDPQMLGMFERGEDMHSFTAREMFKIAADVDPDKVEIKVGVSARKIAKGINFGVAYGQTEFGFAKKIGVPVEEAKEFIEQWYGLYSGARSYLEEAGKSAVRKGYSKTLLGRKRFYGELPEAPFKNASWEEKNAYQRQVGAVRRAGMNHVMQGTSADITKLALALFYERCPKDKGFLVGVVHDELLVEAKAEHADEVSDIMADAMYEACCKFLKILPSPRPKVNVGEAWEK